MSIYLSIYFRHIRILFNALSMLWWYWFLNLINLLIFFIFKQIFLQLLISRIFLSKYFYTFFKHHSPNTKFCSFTMSKILEMKCIKFEKSCFQIKDNSCRKRQCLPSQRNGKRNKSFSFRFLYNKIFLIYKFFYRFL